jgi:hypothetical protein
MKLFISILVLAAGITWVFFGFIKLVEFVFRRVRRARELERLARVNPILKR